MPALRRNSRSVYPKPLTHRSPLRVDLPADHSIHPGRHRPVSELHTPAVARDRDLITATLSRWPTRTGTKAQLAHATQIEPNTLQATLANMVEDGTLEKPARGVYRLTTPAVP